MCNIVSCEWLCSFVEVTLCIIRIFSWPDLCGRTPYIIYIIIKKKINFLNAVVQIFRKLVCTVLYHVVNVNYMIQLHDMIFTFAATWHKHLHRFVLTKNSSNTVFIKLYEREDTQIEYITVSRFYTESWQHIYIIITLL